MIRPLYFAALILGTLLFSGCSTKEYYEPESVKGDWPNSGDLDEPIIDMTSDGAVLEDGQVVTGKGILDRNLPEGYRFIGQSGGWIIAGKIDGEILLASNEAGRDDILFTLKKTVAAASVQGDTLAVLFANNDMALYALSTQQPILKEQGNPPVAVDSRIVNPFFLNDLVLFLTLDGKIVIINVANKQKLRTMIVSTKDHFNNVIYFDVVGNTMVAATSYRILSMADKERRESYELRDIVFNSEGIWISTKQGEVVAMTPSLELKAKQKFAFAHFLGMVVTDDKVYLLEKEGYLIVLDKDLADYEVYEADFDEGYVYVGDKTFYFDDEYITVE
ncbi:MAG: hypothetical protein U9Q62_00385 [Campylobacterota bacterium]|nr:hypothetical protein [Campylobacterota bacterium]